MARIGGCQTPSLWEEITHEYDERRSKAERGLPVSVAEIRGETFDPAKHHPVFQGHRYCQVPGDYMLKYDLNPSVGHPASAGMWIEAEGISRTSRVGPEPAPPPDKKTSSNVEFLEYYVWPYVLPALEATLIKAQQEGLTKNLRLIFNPTDFLLHILYNSNPLHPERAGEPVEFQDIPFVKTYLEHHPRPPIPASIFWTPDETATKIQAAYRGYLVRKDPEVQELRRWQREWRILNRESQIFEEVRNFWAHLIPNGSSSSLLPQASRSSVQPVTSCSSRYRFANLPTPSTSFTHCPTPPSSPTRPSDMQPDHEDLQQDHVDLTPDHVDLTPDHVDLTPDHVDLKPDHVDLKPDHVDLKPDHVDLKPAHVDLDPDEQAAA